MFRVGFARGGESECNAAIMLLREIIEVPRITTVRPAHVCVGLLTLTLIKNKSNNWRALKK
jgi:hypothetical protein